MVSGAWSACPGASCSHARLCEPSFVTCEREVLFVRPIKTARRHTVPVALRYWDNGTCSGILKRCSTVLSTMHDGICQLTGLRADASASTHCTDCQPVCRTQRMHCLHPRSHTPIVDYKHHAFAPTSLPGTQLRGAGERWTTLSKWPWAKALLAPTTPCPCKPSQRRAWGID